MTSEQYYKLIRIYVDSDLSDGSSVNLTEEHVHYLKNVMRKDAGDSLRLFNGRDGEFLAEITELKKNKGTLSVISKLHEQKHSRDIWAVASVIKKIDISVEKACELGASRFIAVETDKTVVHKIRQDRLQAIAIEASEQCERLEVMQVEEKVEKLENFINSNKGVNFIVCLERNNPKSIIKVAEELRNSNLAVVVGPEGGFSAEEVSRLEKMSNVYFAALGSNILRAETAIISALSAVQLVLDLNN